MASFRKHGAADARARNSSARQPEPEPPPLTGDNRVDIVGSVQRGVTVIINGQVVRGQARCINLVDLQIELHGDVMVTINGQDFHHEPTIPPNQCRITATVFGGESDYNVSAYDEQVLNDVDLYVAVPDRFGQQCASITARPACRARRSFSRFDLASAGSILASASEAGRALRRSPMPISGGRPIRNCFGCAARLGRRMP